MSGRPLRGFGLQMLILAGMIGLATVNEDVYVAVAAIAVVLLPPVNWTVAAVLIWTSRQDPAIRSLSDAADNALTWAVNSTAAAVVGLLVLAKFMGLIGSTGSILAVLLGFIVVTSSLPAFRFLRTWREVWMPMIQGGRGEKGDRGERGERGEKGEQGERGESG